jgi:erythrin-vacuolar iron transport family protein
MLSRFSLPGFGGKRRFDELSEKEVLALAIASEEEDGRIYAIYAQKLRTAYPASAAVFDGMASEEDGHRQRLLALYQQRFGNVVLPIRREHVADFYTRKPVWLVENLGLDQIRAEAEDMEAARPMSRRGSFSARWRRPKPGIRPRPRASPPSISATMPAPRRTSPPSASSC